jgi:menaquinone-dependent protoporphyrinogen oxidase
MTAPDAFHSSAGLRVLVAYASGHGSTTGVAKRLETRLAERGGEVDLRTVEEVEGVGAYDAIVLGSPVYDQSWLPQAVEFVRANGAVLAARPVWLFSVGSFGDTNRVIGRLMTREPKQIGELRKAIRPREYRVFAGVIDRHQWPFRLTAALPRPGRSLGRQPRLVGDRRLG